jgi:5-methylcytosine-specific restriction endonuclease McrA
MSRNTTIRNRHRRIIAKDEPPCHICGQPINYQAHHLDPMSFTIDHITPINRGGTDTLDNCAAAHRKCNRDKSDKIAAGVHYITERSW